MMGTRTAFETSFFYMQVAVPVFTGEKYEHWFVKMKTLFLSQGLWDIVQDGPQALDLEKSPETTTVKISPEARMRDAQALFLIHQGVTETIFPRILCATTAKEAWETLKEQFRGSSRAIREKLQVFWTEFHCLQMKEGESVADLVARAINLINEIKCLGDPMDNKDIALTILNSLPRSFEPAVTTITVRDLTTLTVTDLTCSLISYEALLKRRSEEKYQQKHTSRRNL